MAPDMNHPVKRDLLPVLAVLGAVFLWGSSFSAMRVVLYDFTPMTVMFCRLAVAGICLLPFIRQLIPKNYSPGEWKILLSMVIFQPCLYFLCESYALRFTTSSQAGIIAATMPLMVAAGAWLFLSETITIRTMSGLFFTITGVVLLTLFQSENTVASNPVLGNLLEVGAMASAAASTIIIKRLTRRYSPWTLTAMQVAAGIIFFSPGIGGILRSPSAVWTGRTIILLVFLGSFVSLGAFALYNWGISKIDASRASIFINLVPVTAVFLGWILLGETLNLWQCAAAGIVIIGIVISNRK